MSLTEMIKKDTVTSMDINDQRDLAEEAANRAEAIREGLEEVKAELDETRRLIDTCIAACKAGNSGARIALYLDSSMTGPNGIGWLPVMNIEGDGSYLPFDRRLQVRIASWFPGSFRDAKEQVDLVNSDLGYSPEEVRRMVIGSMNIAAARRDREELADDDTEWEMSR